MGYSIHDLFEDNFTSDKIRGYMSTKSYKGDVAGILANTLGLNSHTFSSTQYLDNLIMMVLEELLSLEGIKGVCNRLGYAFNLVEPESTLTSVVYKSLLAEVKCGYSNLKHKRTSPWNALFNRVRTFSVEDLLGELESSRISDTFLSPLDILLNYLKSLKNKDVLRGIVSGLLDLKFNDEDVLDSSVRLSALFGMLSYDEPFELSRIRYRCGSSTVSIKFSPDSEEA